MSEPSGDKIELLVRSVLAAVDARLQGVRDEVHTAVTDSELRKDETLQHIHELERRLEHLERRMAGSAATDDSVKAALTAMPATKEEAVSDRPRIATIPSPPPSSAASISTDTARTAAQPAADPEEPIDLSRLADLLSERLGHLSLPPRAN
ncbi:MAG: hypothetical protein WCC60_07785 [Ilumatobacteraceae bacterium]